MKDVILGKGCKVADQTNLYGCKVGDRTKIGAFVEIQRGAVIGSDCKISSHSFICDGVTIEDNVFVGHHVVFINDKNPRAANPDGSLESEADWKNRFVQTIVRSRASIGSNATIMGGVTIGLSATIGAGAVVTRDVPAGETWVGNPARKLGKEPSEERKKLIQLSEEAKDLE